MGDGSASKKQSGTVKISILVSKLVPEMDARALLFSLVPLSAIMFFLIFNWRKAFSGVKLPPGPYSWPIVGNLFQIDPKKPHVSIAKLAESFGPLISLRIGSRLFIIASNATAAREIFKTHDREFSGRYLPRIVSKMPEIGGSTIALSAECNERWRLLRRIGHDELFSSQALESHSQSRVKKVNEMLAFLNSKDGQPVKIVDSVFTAVANVLTRMMVSQDIVKGWSYSKEMQRTVRRLIDFGIPGLVDLYPGLFWLDFWSKRRVEDFREINRTTWGDVLSERKRKQKQDVGMQSQDFLDILIRISSDDNEIYNILSEFFVSSESLTTLIEWAMAELTRNQDALVKLREELTEAAEGTVLSGQHLTRLPYLQACIKETLRLHPPTPFLVPRSALQTCEVMNYGIPKNAVVIVNAYALGRDPKTWEDPLSFKPERFLNRSLDLKGTNYELLPFGGGRRICSGFPLALKLIELILASLVHAFDWSLLPGIDAAKLDMNESFGITLRREKQLLLIPKKRNDLRVE